MIAHYIEDPDGTVRLAKDIQEWSAAFKDRRSHQSLITLEHDQVRVSTVFLGLNHNFYGGPPLLYETMVFGGDLDQECRRYHTREEAMKGHEEMVQEVINTRSLPERTEG